MTFKFDPAKDALNRVKHGLSLQVAEELEWDVALGWIDIRRDYGEERIIALCPRGDRLYCVVFVERGPVRRVVSLRRANRREVKHYVKATESEAD